MNLSPYEFDESDVLEDKPKKKNFGSYTFADSASYGTYRPYEEDEPEELPSIKNVKKNGAKSDDKFKEFLVDNSMKGLVTKGLIIFLSLLYITWVSLQTLFTITGKAEASFIPHKVAINIIGNSPALALFTALLVGVLAMAIMFMINKKGYLEEAKYTLSQNGTHGTAKMAEDENMQDAVAFRELNNPEGMCLGRKQVEAFNEQMSICVTKELGRNMNFAIFGSSGSGKWYSFPRPTNTTTRSTWR